MSLLPGYVLKLPENARCDEHSNRPAVSNRVGECDSWGYEEHLRCWHCEHSFKRYKKRHENGVDGYCDWCKSESSTIKPIRDLDEGSFGPVYTVCEPCRTAFYKRQHEEYDNDYPDCD